MCIRDSMRIQGHVDIELDEVGRWQAQRVAQALADGGNAGQRAP